MAEMKQLIQDVFREIADGLETGSFGQRTALGITLLGSEISEDNLFEGAVRYARNHPQVRLALIGPKRETDLSNVDFYEAADETEQHKVMEKLLDDGVIQACVTQHYNFPIGVSTVGRVLTPGRGKEMAIANTTGTSAANRVEAMVRNAIAGIIASKAMGITQPTLGVLNVEGARKVEQTLQKLVDGGYDLKFSGSERADGGAVMRGNDLLLGTPDVMVTDSLTGNLLMKVFSSFQSGGVYETTGFGYGPGIGEGYNRVILILSRVSGVPVIEGALEYARMISEHNILKIAKEEYQKAKAAGLDQILQSLAEKAPQEAEEIKAPMEEVVTGSLAGIDIMELEDAVKALWKAGIYAQSGMGCTGPIILVNEGKMDQAREVLQKAGFLALERPVC